MKKILIVEDVEFNIDLLVQLLDDEYELLIAENGELGVVLAETEHPDLILMDISLPVMDGLEATAHIKANPTLANIPIIAVTAHAMRGDEEKALAAGCNDFMTKPIDDELLFVKLAHFLNG